MSLPNECPFEALVQEGKEIAVWEKDTTHNWKQKPGRKSLGRSEEDFKYENRPFCTGCNKNKVAISHSEGKLYMRKYCHTCADNKYKKGYRYILNTESVCELCGFKPEDLCQLDVDHIDGNRQNEQRSNLQVLCANCHRLKTYRNGDSVNIRFKKGLVSV